MLILSLTAALARRGPRPAPAPAAPRGPAPSAVPTTLLPAVSSGPERRVDRTVYPDSPLRLWFTAPALGPVAGAQTRQVWDPTSENPLQDLDGNNALVTDYLMGNGIDEPLGRVAGGATHAFLGDHLMSVRGLVDSAGVQTNRYTYAAFGLGRSQVEAVANRLRFSSRELDPATGLQFNRHRHYLPSLGRWTQRDPIGFRGDGPNLYVYVGNNPVINVDPTGRVSIVVGGVVVTVILCLGYIIGCDIAAGIQGKACAAWCNTGGLKPVGGRICSLPECPSCK